MKEKSQEQSICLFYLLLSPHSHLSRELAKAPCYDKSLKEFMEQYLQ